MIKFSPSILSADFANLGRDVCIADRAGADYIHIDVMDGQFVPNISIGLPVIQSLRSCTDKVFDVHLMMEEPSRFIHDFAKAGSDIITVHAEACTHLHRTLQLIHKEGKKAGVALNPATSLNVLDYVLEDVDMVLIMSVNPGFGGQSYIPAMTEKIRVLKKMIVQRGLDIEIEVDGGVDLEKLPMIIEAGANVIVAGSKAFIPPVEETMVNFIAKMKACEVA